MSVEIKNWRTGEVICEGATVREAVLDNLDKLSYANLSRTDLSDADFSHTDLSYVDLSDADFSHTDFSHTDLSHADLSYTDLFHTNLSHTKLSWYSHDLLAEILRRAAGTDPAKLKLSGLVLVSREKCWEEFFAMDDPLQDWAIGELAKWVQPGDGAPECIRAAAAKAK